MLGLLAPLIALYVLKVRRRPVRVASTWLWASAERDLLAKSPWKKLLARLSLLLQIVAIALIAFSLARPATTTLELPGSRVAIVIDVSASMSATDAEGNVDRLARARSIAAELLSSLPPRTEVLVIEAGREPRIASPLDRDKQRVVAALATLSALDVEGDIDSALALAVDQLRGVDDARVILISDGQWARPAALQQMALPLTIRLLGGVIENSAIVRSDLRIGNGSVTHREELQAFVVIQHFGAVAKDAFVTMRREAGGEVLDSRRLSIEPGPAVPVLLTAEARAADYGKGIVFEIAPHDQLPVDDIAFATIPRGPKLPVVLSALAQPSAWLERGLRADSDVELAVVARDALLEKTVDPGALIVADGYCPGADASGGDLLIVRPPAGRCFGAVVGEPVERPAITSWDQSDPRLRFLTLDGVSIAKASLLGVDENAALVRTRDGSLVADASTGSRTVTIVGFDVGESDWPLKASFVLFMRNITELARSHRLSSVIGDARTGGALRVAVPLTARDVTATGPGGVVIDVSSADGIVVLPATNRVGHYRVRYGGDTPNEIVVPVNLASAAESNLASRAELDVGASVAVREEGEPVRRPRELGWLLALAALIVLLVEVTHHTRRRATGGSLGAVPPAPERRRS